MMHAVAHQLVLGDQCSHHLVTLRIYLKESFWIVQLAHVQNNLCMRSAREHHAQMKYGHRDEILDTLFKNNHGHPAKCLAIYCNRNSFYLQKR